MPVSAWAAPVSSWLTQLLSRTDIPDGQWALTVPQHAEVTKSVSQIDRVTWNDCPRAPAVPVPVDTGKSVPIRIVAAVGEPVGAWVVGCGADGDAVGGAEVGPGVGLGVGLGVGDGVEEGVGAGVGLEVGDRVGLGVGDGVGGAVSGRAGL